MTEKEAVFLQSADDASGGRDGNLEFTCPLCGGYAIGVRKSVFDLIIAHCSHCKIAIKERPPGKKPRACGRKKGA